MTSWNKKYKKDKNPPQEIRTMRFFCGLKPVFLVSKDPEAALFGEIKDIYPIKEYHRTKVRYVYQAMTDEDKWSEDDIISLPPGLCFGAITPRYFKSSNPKTIERIKEYETQGWV